jgi:hypothetical protein
VPSISGRGRFAVVVSALSLLVSDCGSAQKVRKVAEELSNVRLELTKPGWGGASASELQIAWVDRPHGCSISWGMSADLGYSHGSQAARPPAP